MPRPRRMRRLPRQIVPRALEREYARTMLRLVDLAREALGPLLDYLPGLVAQAGTSRQDAGEGRRVRELIAMARDRMAGALEQGTMEQIAERLGKQVSQSNAVQLARQIKAGLGADVYQSDRGIAALIDGFASENVALIKNVPAKLIDDIEQATTRGLASGTPHPALAKELEERFGFARNRAKLIARDQVGKLYGQVNAQRQKQIGITRFIWRTSNDERVRPEHEEREGETYSYDDPPDGEIPGQGINCRCVSEPLLDDIA